jgi:hypothetical protein
MIFVKIACDQDQGPVCPLLALRQRPDPDLEMSIAGAAAKAPPALSAGTIPPLFFRYQIRLIALPVAPSADLRPYGSLVSK